MERAAGRVCQCHFVLQLLLSEVPKEHGQILSSFLRAAERQSVIESGRGVRLNTSAQLSLLQIYWHCWFGTQELLSVGRDPTCEIHGLNPIAASFVQDH